jgi:hypothetical protein
MDADELDARQLRGDPRVMPAQVPDADDRQAHGRGRRHRGAPVT